MTTYLDTCGYSILYSAMSSRKLRISPLWIKKNPILFLVRIVKIRRLFRYSLKYDYDFLLNKIPGRCFMAESNGLMMSCWDGTEGDYVRQMTEEFILRLREELNFCGTIVVGFYKSFGKNWHSESNYTLALPELGFLHTSNQGHLECFDAALKTLRNRYLKIVC